MEHEELTIILDNHHDRVLESIRSLIKEGAQQMTDALAALQQADADLVAAVSALPARYQATLDNLNAEIQALQQTGVDTGALQAVASDIETQVGVLNQLGVTAPAPAVPADAAPPADAVPPDAGTPGVPDSVPPQQVPDGVPTDASTAATDVTPPTDGGAVDTTPGAPSTDPSA